MEALDASTSRLQQWDRRSTDALKLARALNEVSARMDELLALYGGKQPGELYRMGYLGRELELDGRQSELSQATKRLGEIKGSWSTLRGRAVTAGGAGQADELDTTITDAEHAIADRNAEKLLVASHKQLDLIDQLEKILAKAPKR